MTKSRLRASIQPGLAAVRQLWLPFVLLQSLGLLLVLGYFYVPSVARVCDIAGETKARLGLLFVMISMPIACSIVPETFKTITGVNRRFDRQRLGAVAHNVLLFIVIGIVLDLFYRLLEWLFTGVAFVPSVIGKVAIDQFLFTPFISMPLIAISYTLRKASYRLAMAARDLNGSWYEREVLPMLLLCWAYWFPMTSLMYTLPTKLTFVYGMIASAASSTLLIAVAGREETTADLSS